MTQKGALVNESPSLLTKLAFKITISKINKADQSKASLV